MFPVWRWRAELRPAAADSADHELPDGSPAGRHDAGPPTRHAARPATHGHAPSETTAHGQQDAAGRGTARVPATETDGATPEQIWSR